MATSQEHELFRTPDFVRRLRERDRDAVRRVIRVYLPHILRAALGAGLDPERADNVTQDVFRTFIETLPRFEGRSHVRTWLFGILHHKLQETWRERAREDRSDDIDGIVESRFDERGLWSRPPRTPEMDVYDRQIRRHIAECLEQLKEAQRLAFTLREIEGLETPEICKAMEITATNLGVTLFRARNGLRECLEKRGIEA